MRFYHPPNRRWINRDPIGEEGGNNLYCILANNAMRGIDPFGLTVLVTTDSIPQRTENMHALKNGINKAVRAYTKRYERFKVTCTKDCRIKVSGVFNLWIEMRPSTDEMWKIQAKQYKNNPEANQELNALNHELDHFQTWKAFYDFVKTADRYDGVKFPDCQKRANIMMQKYNEYHQIASKHSTAFDTDGKNSGGQYARFPFNTAGFNWE